MELTLPYIQTVLNKAMSGHSYVSYHLKSIKSDSVNNPTIWIDKEGNIKYNKKFIENNVKTDNDVATIILHELFHKLFDHFISLNFDEISNYAADSIINATLYYTFYNATNGCDILKKFYKEFPIEGILRPGALVKDTVYEDIYNELYNIKSTSNMFSTKVSSGEVLTILKEILRKNKQLKEEKIVLIGSHNNFNKENKGKKQQTLDFDKNVILEEFKKDVKNKLDNIKNDNSYGYTNLLEEILLEVTKDAITMKKYLLNRYTCEESIKNFKVEADKKNYYLTPFPTRLSRKESILITNNTYPLYYKSEKIIKKTKKSGIYIYLDVSGSVEDSLPKIIRVLKSLDKELEHLYLFSNDVVQIPFINLLKGKIETTYGTNLDCVGKHIKEVKATKAVVFTDGHFGSLCYNYKNYIVENNIKLLFILFGSSRNEDNYVFKSLNADVVNIEKLLPESITL